MLESLKVREADGFQSEKIKKRRTSTMKLSLRTLAGWSAIIFLSVVAISVSAYVALTVPNEKYTPVVSLVGTTASILAVVWFTSTLIYQSRQLTEQRQQFALTYDQAKRDSRRDALVVVDGILRDAERSALLLNETLRTPARHSPNVCKLPGNCSNAEIQGPE